MNLETSENLFEMWANLFESAHVSNTGWELDPNVVSDVFQSSMFNK